MSTTHAARTDPRHASLAARLRDVLAETFPTWPTWPGGWPGQADAALVDAVFSTRARYGTVVLPLVRRWIAAREALQPPVGTGVSALTTAGRDALAAAVQNDQCVPGGRTRKVDAVLQVAADLLDAGLDTAAQIRTKAYDDPGSVRRIVERTSGVGPAQSSYFLMLLGFEGVKADQLVTAWVERALGESDLSARDIELVVAGAARLVGRNSIEVDHAIWRTESTSRRSASRRTP